MLAELARTEGGHAALGLLVRDQHARRLVRLRAVLAAAAAASAPVCPPAALDRLRADWALLEDPEHADRDAVAAVLLHPLTGPWAQRCLYGLTAAGPAGAPAVPELAADLAHFGAIAAAAAVRAGLTATRSLTAHGDLLALPTLGALRTYPGARVEASLADGVLTLRQGAATPPVEVRTVRRNPADDAGAATRSAGPAAATASDDPRWLPLGALPALLPGAAPVLLDDLDPYRTAGSGLERHGLGAVTRLDPGSRAAWAASWAGTEPVLRIGGEHRTAEAALLLRCLVPLAPPPGRGPAGESASHCSGTRREAFGAVLSSRPSTPAYFAATLVHELQHTKLSALAALVRLRDAGPAEAYFAPWRTDPRPFDGLLQGAYSHLALADYWQRYALAARGTTQRDLAWAEHARCAEQVGAVLPVLTAADTLTPEGRVVVGEMAATHDRLAQDPPPTGHAARARAYVATARTLWRQRHHTDARPRTAPGGVRGTAPGEGRN
ncbi:aKG-HExxH-type peptide beta-hydroxylase [Streptomyces sp. 8L]|uniref:aKG-HExxH-type peptide beta-hydroxylase n=1 Tax=Streptomyces sp. 8L TaxID=2877242 RepID=UPI001CD4AF31|nr:HEXXH motif-containing putative peptide modification protein [Streptomyces sp. 8L]MCA1222922.1 HEXXH motif domain-containing protein [Streptomyces sp. 8L]